MMNFKRYQRTGRWTSQEETFADEIVQAFHHGTLDVPKGTEISLRRYLADKLLCSPKRVSKKYESSGYDGKRLYVKNPAATKQDILATTERLRLLELDFLRSLETRKAEANSKTDGAPALRIEQAVETIKAVKASKSVCVEATFPPSKATSPSGAFHEAAGLALQTVPSNLRIVQALPSSIVSTPTVTIQAPCLRQHSQGGVGSATSVLSAAQGPRTGSGLPIISTPTITIQAPSLRQHSQGGLGTATSVLSAAQAGLPASIVSAPTVTTQVGSSWIPLPVIRRTNETLAEASGLLRAGVVGPEVRSMTGATTAVEGPASASNFSPQITAALLTNRPLVSALTRPALPTSVSGNGLVAGPGQGALALLGRTPSSMDTAERMRLLQEALKIPNNTTAPASSLGSTTLNPTGRSVVGPQARPMTTSCTIPAASLPISSSLDVELQQGHLSPLNFLLSAETSQRLQGASYPARYGKRSRGSNLSVSGEGQPPAKRRAN